MVKCNKCGKKHSRKYGKMGNVASEGKYNLAIHMSGSRMVEMKYPDNVIHLCSNCQKNWIPVYTEGEIINVTSAYEIPVLALLTKSLNEDSLTIEEREIKNRWANKLGSLLKYQRRI